MIVIDAALKKCPKCKSELYFQEGLETRCPACEYVEPEKSAEIISLISSALHIYTDSLGIDTVLYQKQEFETYHCMLPTGLLPIFCERTEQIQHSLHGINGFEFPIHNIYDVDAIIYKRPVITSTTVNLPVVMALLVESVHEIHELTQSISTKYYRNQVCLDFMPNLNPLNEITRPVEQKMRDALSSAVKQKVG